LIKIVRIIKMGQEESSMIGPADNFEDENLNDDNLEKDNSATQTEVPSEDADSEEEKAPSKVMCPHCEDSIATYRCKLKLENMAEVYKYSKLLAYWVPDLRTVGGIYIVSYVGCDKCMIDKWKDPFTHVPGGWLDDLFVEDTYEDARLD